MKKEAFKKVIANKKYLNNISLMLIIEIIFCVLIMVKSGNINAYLSLVLPLFIILAIVLAYTQYMESEMILANACCCLLQIGVAMQCIIQKDEKNFALKEQVILITAIVTTCLFLFLYERVLKEIPLQKIRYMIILFTLLIYILLFIFGRPINGTKAWIFIAGVSLQLTEFIKILFIFFNAIVFCGESFSDKNKLLYSGSYLLLNVISSILIGEMGSLMIMGIIYVIYCILFINTKKCLLKLTGFAITCISLFMLSGVGIFKYGTKMIEQKRNLSGIFSRVFHVVSRINDRFTIWRHPELDPMGMGYQGIKAKQAMALGGIFGSNYHIAIPVEESDYIFISILLNMGIVIAILIVILFLIILVFGIKMYLQSDGKLETGIIAGSVFYICIQSFTMILGSTGFFIMTGVPISFISDGGTALIVAFIMAGLVLTLGSLKYKPCRWKKTEKSMEPSVIDKIGKVNWKAGLLLGDESSEEENDTDDTDNNIDNQENNDDIKGRLSNFLNYWDKK